MAARVWSNGTVDLRTPKMRRYRSPAAVFAAYAQDSTDDAITETAPFAKEMVDSRRCWGWTFKGVIHFWAASDVTLSHLVDLFAHEIAHLVHDAKPSAVVKVGKLDREEQVAETYAAVAGLALELAQRYV